MPAKLARTRRRTTAAPPAPWDAPGRKLSFTEEARRQQILDTPASGVR